MTSSEPVPPLTIASPQHRTSGSSSSSASSSLERPKFSRSKSSGTMIIPSNSKKVELGEGEEEYPEDDVRCMSPKRSLADVEKLGEEARNNLMEQAKQLQASLEAIVGKVESVKEEHDKLEGGNKFLQQYIGDLIQTTKITSSSNKKTSSRK